MYDLNKFILLYQEKDPVTEAPVNLMLTDSLDVYLQDIDEEDMSAIGALFDDDVIEEPVGIDI